MITNERQYRITKAETDRFQQTLNELTAQGDQREGVHPLLVQAERDALRSQLDDLAAELREYEALKAGDVSIIKIDSFGELPEGLIKARIAAGLSQKAGEVCEVPAVRAWGRKATPARRAGCTCHFENWTYTLARASLPPLRQGRCGVSLGPTDA